jgi:hypothetical protein
MSGNEGDDEGPHPASTKKRKAKRKEQTSSEKSKRQKTDNEEAKFAPAQSIIPNTTAQPQSFVAPIQVAHHQSFVPNGTAQPQSFIPNQAAPRVPVVPLSHCHVAINLDCIKMRELPLWLLLLVFLLVRVILLAICTYRRSSRAASRRER